MKTLLLILSGLLITSCTTVTKKREVSLANSCFVQWSLPAYKAMYKQGKTMSRDEKQAAGLMFPAWENKGIYVTDRIDHTYLVRFDLSDPHGLERAQKLLDKNLLSNYSTELTMSLATQVWKIHSQELKRMLKGYEKVDCVAFFSSQYRNPSNTESN